MGTGLLSRAEFERQVERFVDISTRIDDEWQLVRSDNGSLYMMKKCVLRHPGISKLSETQLPLLHFKSRAITDKTNKPLVTMPTGLSRTADCGQIGVHQKPETLTESHLLPGELSQLTSVGASETLSSHGTHSPGKHHVYNLPQNKSLSTQSADFNSGCVHETDLFKGDGQLDLGMQSEHLLSQRTFSATQDTETPKEDQLGLNVTSENPLDMEMESDTEEDESCMTQNCYPEQTPLTYDYHVVYSESYSVPVLYFNIFTPDGKLLPLNDVWNLCPQHYQAHIKENKWTTLTQQEHPLLGRPYLQLHPCHTAELMAQVTTAIEPKRWHRTYLATWLSTVGPLVALKIAPAYTFG